MEVKKDKRVKQYISLISNDERLMARDSEKRDKGQKAKPISKIPLISYDGEIKRASTMNNV